MSKHKFDFKWKKRRCWHDGADESTKAIVPPPNIIPNKP